MLSNGKIVATADRLSSLCEPALLLSESREKYESLLLALQQEIKPKGRVEQIYLEDLTAIAWEIQRLRRCKAGIINNGFRSALQTLLQRLLLSPDFLDQLTIDEEAARLAMGWFVSKKCKKQVLAILNRQTLDETAIEAEAIRQSWSDLELIERMLMSLRSRLDKVFGCVADYRDNLARRMGESSDRILQNDGAICLDHVPNESVDHGQ